MINRRYALAGLGAACAAGAFHLANGRAAKPGESLLPMAAHAQEAQGDGAAEVVEMVLGADDAPVEVIEYASFTCPHCANFHAGNFKRLKADYIDTGKVRFIYREVYFDRYGLWAGMVARCGGEMRYFGIVDLIYENQKEWAQGSPADIAEALKKLGKTAGITDEQLDACLSNEAQAEALVASFQKNTELHGINATPSFVIDGTTYSNMAWADFAEILDDRLAAAEG